MQSSMKKLNLSPLIYILFTCFERAFNISKEDIHINFKNVSYLLYLNIFLQGIKIKICKIYIAFPFYFANVQCCIGEFYMA